MENATRRNNSVKVYYDPRTLPTTPGASRISRLFVESSKRDEPFRITVKQAFGQYHLDGQVDSQNTREIVLSIVRTNHPYRDIIDNMTIFMDSPHREDHHAA